jgi:hypothetical protein
MHPKQTEYDKRSRQAKKEAGLVRVERWIHKSRREEFDRLVKTMQEPK